MAFVATLVTELVAFGPSALVSELALQGTRYTSALIAAHAGSNTQVLWERAGRPWQPRWPGSESILGYRMDVKIRTHRKKFKVSF